MPKGLKIPISVNSKGGFATVDGDDNDAKIIKLALMDGENENAFQQDITLGVDMVFDILDPIARSRVINRLIFIFENFKIQKRFDILKNTISWNESSSNDGEVVLSFRYLNLESDEEKTYEQKFNSGA